MHHFSRRYSASAISKYRPPVTPFFHCAILPASLPTSAAAAAPAPRDEDELMTMMTMKLLMAVAAQADDTQ